MHTLLARVTRGFSRHYHASPRGHHSLEVDQTDANGPTRKFVVSPMGLELAKKHNVDLGHIFPTGAGNRITLFDVQNFVEPRTFRFYHEAKGHAKKVRLDHNKTVQLQAQGSKGSGKEVGRHQETAKAPEKSPGSSGAKGSVAPEQPGNQGGDHHLLDGEAIKSWSVNPKAKIPHFWLRKSVELKPVQQFLKDIPEDKRVGPEALYIKLVRDALLEDPEFFTFRINGQFVRAQTIWIHYINLADPNLNRSVNVHSLTRLAQEEKAPIDHSQPSISIVDASGTDITVVTPIIRLNRVS